ncbi:PDR/VanB family oxidoreductase [Teredinibacter turnerae]|uniref:PDR/VanB family oxidoreductase n=1 Tax=Teredinibacter turnerae TaxID=2426 RepID=UPI0030D1275A
MNDKPVKLPISVSVQQLRDLCEGVREYTLAAVDGCVLPAFEAGAHIDITAPNGQTRQYSLCNTAGDCRSYIIAVRRESDGRGGSIAIHDQLHLNSVVTVSGLRNAFPLAVNAPRSLLFAAGIGITPLLAMARTLQSSGQPFQLHYSVPTATQAPYLEELRSEPFAGKLSVYFSREQGRIDAPAVFANADPAAHIYVCGPQQYRDYILQSARNAGWPEAQLHYEAFATEINAADNKPFDVVIASTGARVAVRPTQTIVEALGENGVAVPVSCEVGTCGTCYVGVKEGEVDHRDAFLTEDEKASQEHILTCCSRALSDTLVLDL